MTLLRESRKYGGRKAFLLFLFFLKKKASFTTSGLTRVRRTGLLLRAAVPLQQHRQWQKVPRGSHRPEPAEASSFQHRDGGRSGRAGKPGDARADGRWQDETQLPRQGRGNGRSQWLLSPRYWESGTFYPAYSKATLQNIVCVYLWVFTCTAVRPETTQRVVIVSVCFSVQLSCPAASASRLPAWKWQLVSSARTAALVATTLLLT